MRVFAWSAVSLILAAGMQGSLGDRIGIGWAKPDFVLVVALILAIHRTMDGAAVTGFFAGLLHSAILNAYMMALTVSRTITCLIANRVFAASLGRNALTAAVVVSVSTVIAQILYLFLAMPPNIWQWLTATIGGAVYNGILAIPCYWLLKRVNSTATR